MLHLLFILASLLPMSTHTDTIWYQFSTSSDASEWEVQDDTVMGGRSKGNFEVSRQGVGRFHGHVSLENDGGFSSINHTLDQPIEPEGTDRFVLRVKGDGKVYQFRVMADEDQEFTHYGEFKTTGEWQTVEMSFDEMTAIHHGEPVDVPNYEGDRVAVIDFLIANGEEQDFELLIQSVGVK
ncbi:CIA30 family protein [Neolewinella litorea]|uniref:CIA30 family protein n=1 Tax=Neolewinella litorea TaxID=2562452 RepID=A0A4V3XLL9_9BACT|nr:CIA30 family protein [Neolewinella litorea]THH41423.1 CIA30 family protein [Neolewinella litorea]